MQLFGGQVDKIRFQKLLFLFSLGQVKRQYDFVPFKFGCYSYSAHADMKAMVTRGLLMESRKDFIKLDKIDYLAMMSKEDFQQFLKLKAQYGRMSKKALIRYTYINYPFYATRSEIATKILSKLELEKVKASKPHGHETVLYTIGYEGISLEEYLVRLLRYDIKVLVDVRRNPLSMKYGFSKSTLKRFCESLGIQYVHVPEVGIRSEDRQGLRTQADYDKLFSVYQKQSLEKTSNEQNEILRLLQENNRIALTCFEANVCQCHRKHLAEAIKTLPGFEYNVAHI